MEDVIELSKTKPKSRERRTLLMFMRSMGNMESADREHLIPKRRKIGEEADPEEYLICPDCKNFFKKTVLHRHRKRCLAQKKSADIRSSAIMNSLVFSACRQKYGKTLNKMNLKDEVLNSMRKGDAATKEILKDILIFSWGDDLLKTMPTERSKYHLVAKMRRCARFVIEMRILNPTKYTDMLSCLKPDAFDHVIEATKRISRYDPETRTFGAASTALQFGVYLKQIADLTKKIVLRKTVEIPIQDVELCLRNLKYFKDLVATQWSKEIASLANKNLIINTADKISLIPLTEDIDGIMHN